MDSGRFFEVERVISSRQGLQVSFFLGKRNSRGNPNAGKKKNYQFRLKGDYAISELILNNYILF